MEQLKNLAELKEARDKCIEQIAALRTLVEAHERTLAGLNSIIEALDQLGVSVPEEMDSHLDA